LTIDPCSGHHTRMGALNGMLDILFPRVCAACGVEPAARTGHVCWDCLAAMRVVQHPFCELCGDPVDGTTARRHVCSLCLRNTIYFDLARSAARYRDSLRVLLQAFKFNKATWLCSDLVHLLEACVRSHFPLAHIDCIAFVPLFPPRERERNYNQARLLARALARRLDRPLLHRALLRVRATGTQVGLNAGQRRHNVREAFVARSGNWIQSRAILLVDDIMTTGATVNECARVLKQAGAAKVYVATVARG